MLFFDTETYSPVNLKVSGVYPYAEHPEAEVLIVTYAIGDGPVQAWAPVQDPSMPADLGDALDDVDLPIVAHNAQFDRVVCRHALWPKYAMRNRVPTTRWRCTMVRAYSCGLPGALGDLVRVLGIPQEQQKIDGRQFINRFCIPDKKGKRTYWHEYPEEWAKFLEYAKQDIVAMREAVRRMPVGCWSPSELALWHLDQLINDRGFLADRELAEGAIDETTRQAAAIKADIQEATDGAVQSVTQRDKFLQHVLEAFGVPLPDLKQKTLERRLDDPDLPDEAKELIRLRLEGSKASVSKYKAALAGLSADDRMRGTLQFMGAGRTGRWSGRRFQPHNMARPTMKKDDIAAGIAAMRRREAWADFNVMELAKNAVRGLIIAKPGHKLVIADLANIEGRGQAWCAGEEWKLGAFRLFDSGKGPDLYKVSYGRAFGIPPEKIEDGSNERQVGKVIELACGYQGAVGAFQTMAALYRVEVSDARALELVKAWRKAHPAISKFWYDLLHAVEHACATKKPVELGPLVIRWKGDWLSIRLPSGRHLYYPKPDIDVQGKLTFAGVDRYTKKWDRTPTYGGKLFENVIQALSRDVLALGMIEAEKAGYHPVLTVHDEIITEVPDTNDYSPKGLAELMTRGADWTKHLPLAAAGFEDYRYRKG